MYTITVHWDRTGSSSCALVLPQPQLKTSDDARHQRIPEDSLLHESPTLVRNNTARACT
ncbi:MAG: hypothetical protein RRA35_10585 [Desulfomonilia bacterium]|nr:hypothetical protein [Desulfomonilia bacterium]